MTKQEFLAISLPYQLKVYDCIGNSIELVDYSKGCPKCVCEAIGQVKNEDKCVNVFQAAYDKQLKPILYPLSDLTKFIEHKGEKIIPLLELKWNRTINGFTKSNIEAAMSTLFFKDALKLIEWHFDLFGGIDNGEAIDVNTLTENPYK